MRIDELAWRVSWPKGWLYANLSGGLCVCLYTPTGAYTVGRTSGSSILRSVSALEFQCWLYSRAGAEC
jgi:hypothetical protein